MLHGFCRSRPASAPWPRCADSIRMCREMRCSMDRRWFVVIGALVVAGLPDGGAAVRLIAQADSSAAPRATRSWTPPRTPDGQFDIEGVWDFSTITPLERPGGLGDKQVFSDEEAAAFEKAENI